jgi:hypothetical protein
MAKNDKEKKLDTSYWSPVKWFGFIFGLCVGGGFVCWLIIRLIKNLKLLYKEQALKKIIK